LPSMGTNKLVHQSYTSYPRTVSDKQLSEILRTHYPQLNEQEFLAHVHRSQRERQFAVNTVRLVPKKED
jgi:hypothetical protein